MLELKINAMAKRNKIKLTVENTDTGFPAFSDDYPIFTTGQSIPELINNAYEATEFYFEEKKTKVEPTDIIFEIDFKQFFKYYKVINAKEFNVPQNRERVFIVGIRDDEANNFSFPKPVTLV